MFITEKETKNMVYKNIEKYYNKPTKTKRGKRNDGSRKK